MSATAPSSTKKESKMDSKPNPFLQWIPPDLPSKIPVLQPIHKLLTSGSFCDPHQQQEESDSESDDDHDTTTTSVVEPNVPTTTETTREQHLEEDTFNISTARGISEEKSQESPTSPSIQESAEKEEIPPVESTISHHPDEEEIELQLSQDGVEISCDPDLLRSRSLSDKESEEIEDLLVQGNPSNDTTITTLPVVNSPQAEETVLSSDATTIFKFIFSWVVLFLLTVIVQPGSIYDANWFHHQFQQAKDTIQTQRQACTGYIGGKVDTDCVFEVLHNHVKVQVASCHAFIQGETATPCFVQVSGRALSTRSRLAGHAVQDWFHSTHDSLTLEFSKCQNFFQEHHDRPTGCILETPYNILHQTNEWIRNKARSALEYSEDQVQQCQLYLTQGTKQEGTTGCFLEDVVLEWKNFQRRTNTKLENAQTQLYRQFVECQKFVSGNGDNDCVLETAQRAIQKRLEWITAKILDLPTRMTIVASFYGKNFTATTGADEEGVKKSESETLQEPRVLKHPPSGDQQSHVSHALDPRQEKLREIALSYFDHIQPVPEDQIPPRSAFKGEKKHGTKDPAKSRIKEQVVHHHHDLSKEAEDTPTTRTHSVDVIETDHTMSKALKEDERRGTLQVQGGEELNIEVDVIKDETIEPTVKATVPSMVDDSSSSARMSSEKATTTSPPVVTESKDESDEEIDNTGHARKTTTEKATIQAQQEVVSSSGVGDGELLGEMEFVKLEYDGNGMPYLVKGVKKMTNEL